jgi:hypothetical protein
MTRYRKDANGNYIIHGRKYEKLEGSRAQVMHGTAYKTSGELTKTDLIQNKNGRIVSKKKHNLEKKVKRLIKAGYGTRKGHFGAVRLSGHRSSSRKRSTKRRRMRGGTGNAVVPFNSFGVPTHSFSTVPTNSTNLSNSETYY